MNNVETVIIGGGIGGLSTAYYMEKNTQDQSIVLLESSDNVGGKAQTNYADGYMAESGPDSFITAKPDILNLISQLGMDDQIIEPKTSDFSILKGGQFHKPKGLKMLSADNLPVFLGNSLFSCKGKAEIIREGRIASRISNEDESFGSFIERRFGKEMLENYAAPLFSGIYSTPAYELSMQAAFPFFIYMEQKFGSVTAASAQSKGSDQGQRTPFVSLKSGIQSLIEKLTENLKSTEIRTGSAVQSISKSPQDTYLIVLKNGSQLEADNVIISANAIESRKMLAAFPEITGNLSNFTYSSSVIVSLAYEKKDIEGDTSGTGFLLADNEPGNINACTFTSSKWEGRAPEGVALFRCFMRNANDLTGISDEELVELASSELSAILNISGRPIKYFITRWQNALPQYKVGHLDRVKALKSSLENYTGLQLTGAYLDGVGLADCVRRAREAASKQPVLIP